MNKWVAIVLAVVAASISANLINTLAMIMDSLLVKDSWYTLSAIMVDWPGRLLTMAVTLIPYIIITGIVCDSLNRIYNYSSNEEKAETNNQEDKNEELEK